LLGAPQRGESVGDFAEPRAMNADGRMEIEERAIGVKDTCLDVTEFDHLFLHHECLQNKTAEHSGGFCFALC
jgi:hypothetical protein